MYFWKLEQYSFLVLALQVSYVAILIGHVASKSYKTPQFLYLASPDVALMEENCLFDLNAVFLSSLSLFVGIWPTIGSVVQKMYPVVSTLFWHL